MPKRWYDLTLGTSYSTTRYELDVFYGDQSCPDNDGWYTTNTRKSLKAIQRLKESHERPTKRNPDGLRARIVVVSETRRIVPDPENYKEKRLAPDQQQSPEPAGSARRRANFLD